MKPCLGTKTGLALAAAAAISMCVPAMAQAAPRGGHGWSGHSSGRHYGGGGALLGLGVAAAILAAPAYGYGYPRYYAPAYYPPAYYPPAYYSPAYSSYSYYPPAPAYNQQAPLAQVQPQGNYWFYCREVNGYYPNVPQCPGGWQRMNPQQQQGQAPGYGQQGYGQQGYGPPGG